MKLSNAKIKSLERKLQKLMRQQGMVDETEEKDRANHSMWYHQKDSIDTSY